MARAKASSGVIKSGNVVDSWITLPSSSPFSDSYVKVPASSKRSERMKQLRGIKSITINPGTVSVTFNVVSGTTTMDGTLSLPESIHGDSEMSQALKVLVDLIEDNVKRFEKIN